MGASRDKLHGTDKIRKMLSLTTGSEYLELVSNSDTHSEKGGEAALNFIKKNSII
jgi:hypothetical protein